MILIISHYAKNKGVTDHFISFLQDNQKEYFYLRHPFADNPSNYSDLIRYEGSQEKKIYSWKKAKNSILVLIQDFCINLFVSFYLGKKVKKVFGFGSFNVISNIWTNFIFKRKIFFWGCDYSEERFGNKILNYIYLWFETIACKYSYKTIHPSSRQEEVRIRLHQLKTENSILVPNGIDKVRILDWSQHKKRGLLYIGSITEQHGVIQIIKSLYINNNTNYPLYIFGSGNLVDELNNTIKKYNLENKVIYKGYMNPDDIYKYLYKQKINFIGLAPYNFDKDTHVKYGDSLKVKDYLSVGIPYIAPSQLYIPEDLKEFGYIYNDSINDIIMNLKIKNLNYDKLDKVMNKYIRSNVYSSLLSKYI